MDSTADQGEAVSGRGNRSRYDYYYNHYCHYYYYYYYYYY